LGIRTGNSGQAKESDCGPHDEDVEIMDGNGNLAQLPVVPASHKKDVKAFPQIAPRNPEQPILNFRFLTSGFAASVRNSQSLRLQKLHRTT
jgi:hypothetical protein